MGGISHGVTDDEGGCGLWYYNPIPHTDRSGVPTEGLQDFYTGPRLHP